MRERVDEKYLILKAPVPPGNGRFERVKKACSRGDHRSSADFAKAKSVAARRNPGNFSLENPKNFVFGGRAMLAPTYSDGKGVF